MSGELRNAREIDDRLPDGNVLFLSDIQKRGTVTGDPSSVDERRSAVVDVLRSQVTGEDVDAATDQFQNPGTDGETGGQTTDETVDDPNESDPDDTDGTSSEADGRSTQDGSVSSDGQTTEDGPGFGIVGAIASVGWIGYLLRRGSGPR